MSLKNVLAVALGIISAIGGFVDIGDLVFNTQAGRSSASSCCGSSSSASSGSSSTRRCAGGSRRSPSGRSSTSSASGPGSARGSATLVASEVVNLMTCAAEIGGVAICLQLLSGLPYRLLIPLAVVGLAVACWVLPFGWIERVFGYLGLGLLVFAVAAIKLHPDWGHVAHGFVPGSHSGGSLMVYLYFVVGLLGAAMTPYEVYFYSSGAVEDGWGLKELGLNKVTAIIGYGARRLALLRADDRRRRALPAAGASRPAVPRHAGAGRRARARAGRAAAGARRDPLRRRRRGDRDVASPAPTTWPSSSAGGGARRSGRPPPRASPSRGW